MKPSFACSVGYGSHSMTWDKLYATNDLGNDSSLETLVDYAMKPTLCEILSHCRGNTPAMHRVDISVVS